MVFLEILATIVSLTVAVLEFAMLGRALLSWFMQEDSRILMFLTALTEPVIIPFRVLFAKMNWFQNIPIDMPFMAAYFFLILITIFL